MKTRRRNMLLGAAVMIGAADSLPAPAIAQGVKELKLVTSWLCAELAKRLDQFVAESADFDPPVDLAAKDPLTRKVHDSYMAFLAGIVGNRLSRHSPAGAGLRSNKVSARISSFPRKRESRAQGPRQFPWTPVCAGVTVRALRGAQFALGQ